MRRTRLRSAAAGQLNALEHDEQEVLLELALRYGSPNLIQFGHQEREAPSPFHANRPGSHFPGPERITEEVQGGGATPSREAPGFLGYLVGVWNAENV